MKRPLIYSEVEVVKNNYPSENDCYIGQRGIIYGFMVGIRGNMVALVELAGSGDSVGCDFDEITIVNGCGSMGGQDESADS